MRTRLLLPSLSPLALLWFTTVAPLVTVRADETPAPAPPAPNVAVDEPAVRRAIERSLPLLTKAAVGHRENRTCFACHNQGLAIMTLTAARERGFSIDEEELKRQLAHTAKFLERNRDLYREGKGQGGQVDMAGYALLALHAGRWEPDDTTTAVVEYLLQRDQDRDHYVNVSVRPPSEASPITTTYVGLRGLADFGRPEYRERIEARRATVLGWLKQVEPKDHEDRVFRLFALHAAGAPAEILATARQTLLDKQRPDGGWAQLDADEPSSALESDAYATGTALVALHQAGGLEAKHAAFQRGLAYLVKTQLDDASWKVVSRSKPFQTYFESGYPHGKDQFISCAAGGWATLALLQTMSKGK